MRPVLDVERRDSHRQSGLNDRVVPLNSTIFIPYFNNCQKQSGATLPSLLLDCRMVSDDDSGKYSIKVG